MTDLQPGERIVHDAVVAGKLGMSWWSWWVEHPPSAEWCEHLTSIALTHCGGCGRNPCVYRHGVALIKGVWHPIPYEERLLWLQGLVSPHNTFPHLKNWRKLA